MFNFGRDCILVYKLRLLYMAQVKISYLILMDTLTYCLQYSILSLPVLNYNIIHLVNVYKICIHEYTLYTVFEFECSINGKCTECISSTANPKNTVYWKLIHYRMLGRYLYDRYCPITSDFVNNLIPICFQPVPNQITSVAVFAHSYNCSRCIRW